MLALLRAIKKLIHKHNESKYPELAAYKAVKLLYTLKQGEETPLATHLERFQSRLAVIEENTGRFGIDNILMDYIFRGEYLDSPNGATITTRVATKGKPRESFLVVIFLQSANMQRYSKVNEDLANNHAEKMDSDPKTITDVYALLQKYQPPKKVD